MDEPISRRGGTWLVLLLALAILAGLGAAVVSIGGSAGNPFAQLSASAGSTSGTSECIGCGSRMLPSASGPAASAPSSALQGPTQRAVGTPGVRSAATGGRAAAPAPQPAAPAPAAAAPAPGGLCGTIGRTGPPLLQTILSPVAAVCDVLL